MAGADAFVPEDIFRHRVLASLHGGDHGAVFTVTRALEKADNYEKVAWGMRPGQDEAPRALTSAAHGASSPRLDPKGRTLAFLSRRGKGGRQVHLLPLDGGEARRLTHADGQSLSTIEDWSRDGRRLLLTASVPRREDGELEPPHRKRGPEVARYLPYKRDGSGIIVGSRTHLFVADTKRGRVEALTEGDFDVTSAAWSPDGRRLLFVRNRSERQRHRDDLWIADADGRNPRRLVAHLASISHASWSPDGRRIALTAIEEEGDSFVSAWLVDPDSGETRRLGDGDFELEPTSGVQWHPHGDRMALIAAHRGVRVLATMTVPEGKVALHRMGLRGVRSLAACGERLVFVTASMRRGEELHSIDWDGGDERRHGRFNGWMRKKALPHVAKRRFHVPDGKGGEERIDGWLLRPAGEGPFPLLVDFHGGPHSAVLTDFAAHTYWYLLLSRGWAVLAANAVGSSGYGKAFARRLRGSWGELDLPQHVAIVRRLQDEGIADDRLACAGKSYGGYMGAWAVGHVDLFKAAIVCAPVANIESHAGTSDTGYYCIPYLMDGEFHQARERYHRLSPVGYCHRASTPTLILQGENDGRCPRGQAEELFANLIRCSEAPVEMVVYPDSTHAEAESGRPANRVDYHRRLAAWAARWAC